MHIWHFKLLVLLIFCSISDCNLDTVQKGLGSQGKLGFNCVGGSAATAVMKLMGLVSYLFDLNLVLDLCCPCWPPEDFLGKRWNNGMLMEEYRMRKRWIQCCHLLESLLSWKLAGLHELGSFRNCAHPEISGYEVMTTPKSVLHFSRLSKSSLVD